MNTNNNNNSNSNNSNNKGNKAPSQKIPVKPHKKNGKLNTIDIEKLSSFYSDLKGFYDTNNNHFKHKQTQIKYECFHNKDTNEFYLTNFDHQTFHNYGYIHNKILYLNVYEMLYLRQIALIKLHIPSTDDTNNNSDDTQIISNIYSTCNLTMLYLYTYFIQGNKIPKFPPSNINPNHYYDNFILLYENTSSLKQNTLSSLIYLISHTSTSSFSFTYSDFHSILNKSTSLQQSINTTLLNEVYLAIYEDNDFTFIQIKPEHLTSVSI